MLYIPSHILFKKNSYQQLAAKYLSETYNQPEFQPEVEQLLQQYSTTIHKENFCFIADVATGKISRCTGISQCLGFTNIHFTHKIYNSIIHPPHAVVQGMFAVALFQLLINKQISVDIAQPICYGTIALQNKSGKYLYCKRRCYPVQLTGDRKIAAYLCGFTIIKDFNGEDYHTSLYNNEGQAIKTIGKLNETLSILFEDISGFSVQELRILKRYAQDKNTTSETIAKAFKIEKATVSTFNKRIMQKAEKLYEQRFGSAKEAAAYFRRTQLI